MALITDSQLPIRENRDAAIAPADPAFQVMRLAILPDTAHRDRLPPHGIHHAHLDFTLPLRSRARFRVLLGIFQRQRVLLLFLLERFRPALGEGQ
jgi:hypothetical protein